MKKIFSSFAILLCSVLAFAQTNYNKLDSLLTQYAKDNLFMGSVAIADSGLVVFNKSYGFSNLNPSTAASISTQYKIGTVSQLTTSIIVHQLIDEGLLMEETVLSKFYPDIQNSDQITVKHLLTHTSGLKDIILDDKDFEKFAYTKDLSKKQMLKKIVELGAFEAPGKYIFSNTNYTLLGFIIEAVTGQPLATVYNERIAAKAGVPSTMIGVPEGIYNSYLWEKNQWNLATAYTFDKKYGDAGIGVVSTSKDLALIMDQMFSNKLGSIEALKEITTMNNNVGSGIFKRNYNGKDCYFNTGTVENFFTAVEYYPEFKKTISFISNGKNEKSSDIIGNIRQLVFGEKLNAIKHDIIKVPFEIMDKYRGNYFSKKMNLNVYIDIKNDELYAYPEGQNQVKFEPVANNEYVNKEDGIRLIFSNKKFILQQEGTAEEFIMKTNF